MKLRKYKPNKTKLSLYYITDFNNQPLYLQTNDRLQVDLARRVFKKK